MKSSLFITQYITLPSFFNVYIYTSILFIVPIIILPTIQIEPTIYKVSADQDSGIADVGINNRTNPNKKQNNCVIILFNFIDYLFSLIDKIPQTKQRIAANKLKQVAIIDIGLPVNANGKFKREKPKLKNPK